MQQRVFRFGEFTFHSDTGTLTRKNRASRLPDKAARMLEILLERANTLVSREELRQALWPGDQFVDYDQGINVAVNRLRHALHEDPGNPQFLKTIPKRGYSFSGKVTILQPVAEPVEVPRTFAPQSLSVMAPAEAGQVPVPEPFPPSPASSAVAPPAPFLAPGPPGPNPALDLPGKAKPATTKWIWLASVIALTGAAYAIWHLRAARPAAEPHIARIGIAPVRSKEDAQVEAIGAKFRFQLSEALSRLPGVQVPALEAFSTSNAVDLPRVSRELNLDDLLLGTVTQQGDQYDLTFELVRASDATHLAYFEYSGPLKDLPAISQRLQNDIFHYMQSQTSLLQTVKGSTNDPQAYELYLQGEYSMLERDRGSIEKALDTFQRAIALDAHFAAAYAGVATACLKLANNHGDPGNALLQKAKRYAGESVKLDPLLSNGHAVLGVTAYKLDRDSPRGETELRNAIRLDPNQANFREWLAILLVEEGRFDEAVQQLEIARTNAPYWPAVFAMEGVIGVYARRDAFALSAVQKYVSLLPNSSVAHNTLAWVDFDTRHYKDAIEEWRQMAVLQNDHARVALEEKGRTVLETQGVKAYARLRLKAIADHRGTQQVNDFMPAEWYACAGERDQALAELEKVTDSGDPYMLHVGVDPIYDSLHNDPRFVSMLTKTGVSIPPSLVNANSHVCE
jgi:DNA-binding winged helix-turn-helix (wHTH) protein/tetratricopeptide (TPR) repeat protein